jgi:hypothetical protein
MRCITVIMAFRYLKLLALMAVVCRWETCGQAKVVTKVESEAELLSLQVLFLIQIFSFPGLLLQSILIHGTSHWHSFPFWMDHRKMSRVRILFLKGSLVWNLCGNSVKQGDWRFRLTLPLMLGSPRWIPVCVLPLRGNWSSSLSSKFW